MKKLLSLAVFLLLCTVGSSAQKLGAPTLASKTLSEAQRKTLNEGIGLHDAKRYDEAIAKYRSILAECPDCTFAIYELALSLNTKGDKLEAVETAYRGTKYISDELPLFYVLIANNLDDAGKPDDAVKIYQDGLKIVAGDPKFKNSRSSLNFNLGVTLARQKKFDEARQVLKTSVEDSPAHPGSHYMLSVVFDAGRYKIPAMLAAARLVSLEYNSQRSVNAAAIFVEALTPKRDPKTGNLRVDLALAPPKDEGDMTMYDLFVPTLVSVGREKNEKAGAKKTDNEVFVEAVGSLVTMLADDKKLPGTFVGRNYIPFMAALKQKGHLDAFGNLLLFLNNRGNTEAGTWLQSNEPKIRAFFEWARAYRPAAK